MPRGPTSTRRFKLRSALKGAFDTRRVSGLPWTQIVARMRRSSILRALMDEDEAVNSSVALLTKTFHVVDMAANLERTMAKEGENDTVTDLVGDANASFQPWLCARRATLLRWIEWIQTTVTIDASGPMLARAYATSQSMLEHVITPTERASTTLVRCRMQTLRRIESEAESVTPEILDAYMQRLRVDTDAILAIPPVECASCGDVTTVLAPSTCLSTRNRCKPVFCADCFYVNNVDVQASPCACQK